MIIQRGISNTVVETVTEATTIANAYYLFEFIDKSGKVKQYCIASNTSDYTYRYDEFTITEKASPDPLSGEIYLTVGSYRFNIYEQASSTNLDPELSGGVVESGICDVYETETAPTEYEPQTIYNTAYERQA